MEGISNPLSAASRQTSEACLIHFDCPKQKKSMIPRAGMWRDRSSPGPTEHESGNRGRYHMNCHRHNQLAYLLHERCSSDFDHCSIDQTVGSVARRSMGKSPSCPRRASHRSAAMLKWFFCHLFKASPCLLNTGPCFLDLLQKRTDPCVWNFSSLPR